MPREWCDECGGDGSHAYVGGPGYFSTAHGNYLPTDKLVRCEACDGTGWVDPVEPDDED